MFTIITNNKLIKKLQYQTMIVRVITGGRGESQTDRIAESVAIVLTIAS